MAATIAVFKGPASQKYFGSDNSRWRDCGIMKLAIACMSKVRYNPSRRCCIHVAQPAPTVGLGTRMLVAQQ
jgi:hypothetical protein